MFEKLTLVVDIDGTLCKVKQADENYEDLVPYEKIVGKLRYYKAHGAKIVLNTSRNVNSYNGNIGLINANTAKVILAWLDKWDIPYDEIIYGKPWPGHQGFYIDDRTIRPDEFLKYDLNQVEEILKKSREDFVVEESRSSKN
ncbi:capsular biosynthesis protein [Paenibacillus sp. GP183]|uniref:capsular biosynthesis protein n=1 Tax=Paenibacillus sp. GP183 TaxID=1882751 RepID=UPI00089B831F|nr:capsular biosynthesis protein [Paenibacillus sp. GP183]SEC12539.1 capsule biosynthesis phosphatase [Paenibacillus sp. GP183]